MGVYSKSITVTNGTTEGTAELTNIYVNQGVIKFLSLKFPSGCIDKVKIKLFWRGRQVLPTNPEGDFRGDDEAINFQPDFDIDSNPHMLVVKAWNEDVNDHTVQIRMVIK